MLNQSDIDGNPWDGNAHYAPNNATYHLYITYSLIAGLTLIGQGGLALYYRSRIGKLIGMN